MATKLTANVKAGGCASKLSPEILDQALRGVPRFTNSRVLVGYEHSDDAGIYDLSGLNGGHLAIVQTADFFTPIVDDPWTFGAIAAANALSDIYAMGGKPVTALSLVVFPAAGILEDLQAILQGGAEKIRESGAVILGGHSISDEEIKFGYAVTGLVQPDRYWSNGGAKPGDVLLFSKKIGTGVISSALKTGHASDDHMSAAIEQMLQLNGETAQVLSNFKVHSCTDVTGFGLLGHSREMALASGVTLSIDSRALRFLPGAEQYSREGFHSGGLRNNRNFVESCVKVIGSLEPEIEALLHDPQTSGGLLVALDRKDAAAALRKAPELYVIGEVKERQQKPLEVLA